MTGEKAYRGDTVITVLYKITNERPDLGSFPRGRGGKLRAIMTRALERKAEDRYPDARAMSADIEEALRDLGWSGDWKTASDQAVLARARPGGTPPAAPTPLPAPPLAVVYPSDASEVRTPPEKRARTHIALAAALGLAGLLLLGTAAPTTMWRSEKPAPAAATPPAATLPATTLARPTPTPSTAPPVSVTLPAPAPPPATSLAASVTAPVAASPVPAVAPTEARLDRANALMDSGRFAQALAEAKAVLVREPGNATARELAQDAEAAILGGGGDPQGATGPEGGRSGRRARRDPSRPGG